MNDNKIKQLDKDISNKIAAGEVVERPLAVVKELVENAIDAGATKITVEVSDAGKSLIRITDNGHGIHPDDVVLAFERHSTSKIRTINDIYHIASLGFRGEALASIASVSIVELVSKHRDFDMGKKLVLEGGHVVEHHEIGAPQGTSISIKDLFYNTPARLKFMKSNNAEQNAINDIMNKLALSHPEVAFKYIVAGKNVFITPGNNKMYDVILNIYERRMAKSLIALNVDEEEITMNGFISSIEMTRGNRQYQIVFVNNRYVKSKVIDDAVSLAYRTLIPHNRFPIVFLNLTLDPSLIDINIHPAKTEIRFHQEGIVKDFVYKSIAQELNRYNLVPSKPLNSKPVHSRESLKLYNEINRQETVNKSDSTNGATNNVEKVQEKLVPLSNTTSKPAYKHSNHHVDPVDRKKVEVYHETLVQLRSDKTESDAPEKQPLERPALIKSKPFKRESVYVEEVYEPAKPIFEPEETSIYDGLQYKGTMFNTYLIFEKGSEMYLIDQHAAHEKVLFEQYVADFKAEKLASQMILEPITVHVNYMDKHNIRGHLDKFLRLGFNVELFGEDALIVREIPTIFDIKTSKHLIVELVENLNFNMPKEQFELKLDSLMQQSCKKAIKASDALANIEIKALISQLKGLKDPYTCPHGRPIIISISKKEIEKKFNRT